MVREVKETYRKDRASWSAALTAVRRHDDDIRTRSVLGTEDSFHLLDVARLHSWWSSDEDVAEDDMTRSVLLHERVAALVEYLAFLEHSKMISDDESGPALVRGHAEVDVLPMASDGDGECEGG